MGGFGFAITLLDQFVRSSRLHDVLLPGMRFALVVMVIGLIALVASGRIFDFLQHSIGRWLTALTVITLLSVGVSVWPGGAYEYVMEIWFPGLPAFAFLCAFVRTYEQLRKLLLVTACGYGIIPYLALAGGTNIGAGRVGLTHHTFGDSNEMAMVILFWAPFALWAIGNKRTKLWMKVFLGGALLASVPVFFRTGSRAGLVTLAVLSLFVLYRQSAQVRLRLALAAVLALPIGIAATPKVVIDRYLAMFDSFSSASDPIADPATERGEERDEDAMLAASSSAMTRLELLKRSLIVTFANPVLGVGPGMFMVAENEMAVADGSRRGFWKVSHNMYTQISSDLGIPALLVFFSILYRIWGSLSMGERADSSVLSFAPDMRKIAFLLKIGLLTFMTAGLTLSIGYSAHFLYLCGISVVVRRLVEAGRRPAFAPAAPAQTPAVERPAAPSFDPAIARTASPSQTRA